MNFKYQEKSFVDELIIVLAGVLLFVPFLGGLHLFDWDEINFAESAREMILSGNYLTVQIDFEPFWQKPPLYIWMQVISMKIFGVGEFAARFPNAVCGVVTLVFLYHSGKKLYDRRFGILWVLAYTGSILPFVYFKSGIIDPWFNLFIFSSLVYFVYFLEKSKSGYRWALLIFSAALLGMANLTKGPASYILFGLTGGLYWIVNRFRLRINFYELLVFIVTTLFVGGLWYIVQIMVGNLDIIIEFFIYQVKLLKTKDSGHGGFLLYHFVVLFLGVFPASVFALKGFRRSYYDDNFQKRFKIWMIILLVVVLMVFTIVKTKIVHYSSLCYFPVTFLGAYVVYNIILGRINNYRWLNILYAVLGITIGSVITAAPFLAGRAEWIVGKGLIKDPFSQQNFLSDVHWSGFESLVGIVFITGVVLSLILFRKNLKLRYVFVYLNVIVFISGIVLFFTGKAEQYSQRALIEFCKEKSSEDCYLYPWRMKTYAHYFYGDKQVPENELHSDEKWLLTGDADKTVYVILRYKTIDEFEKNYPAIDFLYEKNGFAFCIRKNNFKRNDK